MSEVLPGINFEVGAAIPGNPNFNSRPGVNTFEFFRGLFREMQFTPFPSWPASTQVVSGTGATTVTEDRCILQTGATHASTAGRYEYLRLVGTEVSASINWAKKILIAFSCQWEGADATNLTMRFQFTQALTIGNLAAHGLGIQTNGANINLASFGTGGSQQLVSASTNLVSNDRIFILIEHDPASAIRLYINGVLKATQSTAADIPSTEPAVNYVLYASIVRSGGADTGNEQFKFENLIYGMEF